MKNKTKNDYLQENYDDKQRFHRTLTAQIKLYDSFELFINRLNKALIEFQGLEISFSKIYLNEGSLTYQKVNSINKLQEQLKELFYSSESFNILNNPDSFDLFDFCFHLNNLRSDNNPELDIRFYFNEIKYSVSYRIDKSLNLSGITLEKTKGYFEILASNFYHQTLSEEFITLGCNEISNKLATLFNNAIN